MGWEPLHSDIAGGWQPQAVTNSAEDDWVYGWNGAFWEVVVVNTT